MEESNCERDHQAHTQADSTPGYCRVPDIRFRGFTYAWERRKLDETVSFYSGLTYSPSDICDAGGTLVLRSSNVQSGELAFVDNVYVNDSVASSEQVRKNDLIVVVRNGSRALLGKHAIIRDDMPKTVIGAFMTGIRSDEQEFMNALMSSRAFESEINKNLGATINQITGGMFAEMTFSMPDESEQHAIGSLFFKLDSLVTLHQRKLNKLHHIKKALLEKMFPTPTNTIPEIRFRGFTYAWERHRVGDFLTESRVIGNTGLDAKKLTVKLWGKGVVEKNNFGGSEHTQYFTRRKGQFIYSTLDFLNSAFGVIPEKLDNYESTADLPAFDSDGMNPYFMFFIAIQKSFYLKYGSIADGSRKAKRIHADTFLNMPITVPTIAEQNLIVEYLQRIDRLVTLYQHQLNKLQAIKKALLEKMFV